MTFYKWLVKKIANKYIEEEKKELCADIIDAIGSESGGLCNYNVNSLTLEQWRSALMKEIQELETWRSVQVWEIAKSGELLKDVGFVPCICLSCGHKFTWAPYGKCEKCNKETLQEITRKDI